MKFYKARLSKPVGANHYLVSDPNKHIGKDGETILYFAYLKDDTVYFDASSFCVSAEELKWNFIECAGIKYEKTHNNLY